MAYFHNKYSDLEPVSFPLVPQDDIKKTPHKW